MPWWGEMAGALVHNDFRRCRIRARYFRMNQKFFDLGTNQSPTAIVVGIHPPTDPEKRTIRLVFNPEDEGKAIRRCALHVGQDTSLETDLDAVVNMIREQLTARLRQGEAAPAEGGSVAVTTAAQFAPPAEPTAEGESDDELELPEDEDDANAEDAEAEEEPIELGRSLIQKLMEQLDNREWCEQNIEALMNMALPATIIDGQHRIRGAERCEREIPFTVCATTIAPGRSRSSSSR